MSEPSSTQRKVRVGVIGAGEHITRSHLEYLVADPRVALAAWHDPKAETAEGRTVLEAAGAVWLPSADLVASPEIDLVLIGTPDRFHRPLLHECVLAGKHVMCEKPVGVHQAEIAAVAETLMLASQRGLIVSTCHPRRFDPPILELKRMIENPHKGDPSLAQIVGDVRRFEFGFWYHKPSKTDLHASLMSDHFSHEIDLLRFLFGDRALSFQGDVIEDGEVVYAVRGETTGDSPIEFDFHGYRCLEELEYVEVVRVIGTRGSLTLNLNTGSLSADRTSRTIRLSQKSYPVMFRDLNTNLIDAVLGIAPSYIGVNEILFNNESTATLLDHGKFPRED